VTILERSWSAFPPEIAKIYLNGYGHPSQLSKQLVVDVLREQIDGDRPIRLLDLGCGNGHLYGYFREQKLLCRYTGVDFSDALLTAARERFDGDENATFVKDDVEAMVHLAPGFDVAIYSHVIEMLSSPEASLRRARELAQRILIRFFEPPDFDIDCVELREFDTGAGAKVPYLRRKMSRDYYRLILTRLGCSRVDVYQVDGDKDQIHVLHFP
jgi:SAM-dependent methyltransferase